MNGKIEIIIFGAGIEGRQFSNMILEKVCKGLEQYDVKFFCDNYCVAGSYVNGIKIINAYELQKMDSKYDIYICSEKYLDDIMKQLYNLKVTNNVYYVPPYVYKYKYNNQDKPIGIKMDINKPRMPWLEIEIVSHCNMNCNGCSACANISDKKYMDLNKFERDLIQLKKYFSGIRVLKLFGGEPLLHPQLIDFIECARKHFPDAKLLIHSNGLLVTKCDKVLLETMKYLDAQFVFSLYPETGKLKRVIELCLQKSNVSYEFTPPVYEFRKSINTKGDYNPEEVYSNCCKCINLIKDNLSCGFPYMIERLEKKYGINICKDKYQNCVNIYDTSLNGWEINSLLDSPYNLCAYCAFMRFNRMDNENYYFKWKRENPKLEDWTI